MSTTIAHWWYRENLNPLVLSLDTQFAPLIICSGALYFAYLNVTTWLPSPRGVHCMS